MAKLYFRYGAMNSWKTTAIIQVAHNYEERGMHAVLMKPKVDTKWDMNIVSRLGVTRRVDMLIDRNHAIIELIDSYIQTHTKVDCILVDEVQFMMPSQIDELFWVAVERNIPVICYGLRTDFLLQSFPASERLLALAHTLEELKTICRCGKKAICNMRILDGTPIFSWDQIAIDGNNITYESVCGSCYAEGKRRAT